MRSPCTERAFSEELLPHEKDLLQQAGYVPISQSPVDDKHNKNPRIIFDRAERGLFARWFDGIQWVTISYDFLSGEYQHLLKTFGRYDLLSRAVGAADRAEGVILDCTFGTGRDALSLCKIGCEVISYERQIENYLLASDALTRALPLISQLKGTIELRSGDATQHDQLVQCAYYDPMYRVTKKGKSRKEMEFLHFCGAADSDERLVSLSLLQRHERLVVKRPPGAPTLLDRVPTHVFESKGVRFDMYVERRTTLGI